MNIVLILVFLCTPLCASQQMRVVKNPFNEKTLYHAVSACAQKTGIDDFLDVVPDDHKELLRGADNPFIYACQHDLTDFLKKYIKSNNKIRDMYVSAAKICKSALEGTLIFIIASTSDDIIFCADYLYKKQSPEKDSLAHYACKKNIPVLLKTLLDAGVDQNSQNIHGDTIAHYAASFVVTLEFLKILRRYSVRFDIKNNKGEYPACVCAFDHDPVALEKTKYALLLLSRDVPVIKKSLQPNVQVKKKIAGKSALSLLQRRGLEQEISPLNFKLVYSEENSALSKKS